MLGLLKHHQWDWNSADKEFRRAIELNPNYPTAHHWYSLALRVRGKTEEALSEISRAKELDPLSLIINLNLAEVLLMTHRTDQAQEQLKKTLDLDPNFPGARVTLGLVYAEQGKLDEAIIELQKVRQIVGEKSSYGLGALGYVYAKAGKKDEAHNVLERLLEFSKQGYSMSVGIASVYTGLGDKDGAFEWLEKAYLERDGQLGYLKTRPTWQNLRSDPRYKALIDKIGFDK